MTKRKASLQLQETTRLIAVDLGNAYTNLEADTGVSADYRSILSPLSKASRLADLPEESVFGIDGQLWVSGEACYTVAPNGIEENTTPGRYTTTWYRRLFAAALHRAFYKLVGEEIVYPLAAVSIPARLFRNSEIKQQVAANLKGEYWLKNTMGGELRLYVDKLLIIPEGLGTYHGLAFGPKKNDRFYTGTWMIADFGYLTLDAVFVRDGDYIADASQSDAETGMSLVADAVSDVLQAANPAATIGRYEVDEALRCDVVPISGKSINVRDARHEALINLGRRAGMLLEQWARRQNLTGVILTGGGAELILPYLTIQNLPGVTSAKNPRRANVEGSYIYLAEKQKG